MAEVTRVQTRQRIRDPKRPEKIIEAAARLIARDGYMSVSIAEIGAEAGIVGSGVYRHFESKSAVLVAIFERVIDDLLAAQERAIEGSAEPVAAVRTFIDGQIDFVVGTRAIAQVYYGEIKNLPEVDRRRLRRKQRRYVEGWLPLVVALAPHREEAELRVIVHAAIGAVHSALNHDPDLADDVLRRVLAETACSVIGLAPRPTPLDGQESGGVNSSRSPAR